ncbi:hypothetical protein GCM10012284_38850 [Mangrovihabitans endophyticus]|uniref:GGDEF domain-containing protein n=1 Tax=Mangrovihabitans endophyticus TaxID=1751298 RepID=A0A8J3C2Y0_9ACTN|nr:hypothetical protein GCM10012284_38850 [Mangrovihabitans endophyticus]
MLAELISVLARDTPSVAHLAGVVRNHLQPLGLREIMVCTLDPEDGRLTPVIGTSDAARDLMLAGRVFRTPAGGKPVVDGDRTAIRLRIGGQTVGVLVLHGDGLEALRHDVVATVALHFGTILQSLAAERQRRFITHVGNTIRVLFEQGTRAASVVEAGGVLARAVSDAFGTEIAALALVAADGRIEHTVTVGLPPEQSAALSGDVAGTPARAYPLWRAVQDKNGPVLVADAAAGPSPAGGMVRALGLRSYLAVPLMSASGQVGMVVCGDQSSTRDWSPHDRVLAAQIAAEGALIVEGARLRQAERSRVAELTRQAFHDALTGLPNRTHLLEQAEVAIARAAGAGTRAAVLLIDLDGFKGVNDTIGHHAGDALLHAVAQRLQGTMRQSDLAARLGGDEFALLLSDDPDTATAMLVAERIDERLRHPFDLDGEPVTVGASVGVAMFPDLGTDVASLFRAADAAMYEAKRGGGGVRLAA